jgi:uroporphyrinogen-III synthase
VGPVIRPEIPATRWPRVLVTRAAHQAHGLLGELRVLGIDAVHVPTISIDAVPRGGALDEAIGALVSFAWTVVTSANGARAAVDAIVRAGASVAGTHWAVVGRATGAVVREAGGTVGFMPSRASGADLARELPVADGERILVLRGDRADGSLARELRARGATVHDVIAYRTREAPEASREGLRATFAAGPIDLVVLTSGSTVRGLVALAAAASVDVTGIGVVCIGAPTARAARAAGFRVLAVPETPTDADVAAATARLLRPEGAMAG